jgi:hypothetical protein
VKNILLSTQFLLIIILSIIIISGKTGLQVFAETGGSAPESGSSSRIKNISDSLISSGYGTATSGSWGDWGAMWNRIYSASTFSPNGDLTVAEVSPGKTFYAGTNDRTQKVGTGTIYANQAYNFRDDGGGPNGSGAEDYQGEEAVWTNTNSAAEPDKVWKDERSGLYWSSTISTSMTNNFNMATCPYFSITPPTSLSTYDGLTGSCGNAINACATSTVGGRSNWYLPSQKELLQAYIDGMYNKAGTTLANAAVFTTMNYYWSSTEVSYTSTYAWPIYLYSGYTGYYIKTNTYPVRCVSRD